jgi:outer membrane receptor for ferrienterochelin and colicins
MKKSFLVLYLLVQVCYSGFAQEQQVAIDSMFDLSLEELMNIDVTVGSKNAEKISDAAGVISVITQEELNRFGGVTLRDALERVPGLTSTKGSTFELYGLASRGDQVKSNSGHILYLINGRPIREVAEGSLMSDMLAGFPINIVERIEVIRGPGSVLYGSNAFSAVINVVTKTTDEHYGSVTALTGKDGAFGANGQAIFKVGDVNVVAGGRYMDKGDQMITYKTANTADPANPNNYQVAVTDKAASAFADIQYKKLRATFLRTDYDATHFLNATTLQNEEVNKYNKTFGNLGYGLGVTKNWDMDFNATYTYGTFKFNPSGVNVSREGTDVVGEWTNHITLGKTSRLVAGALYNYNKVFSTSTPAATGIRKVTSDLDRGTIAVYSQLDWWLIKSLKFIGGFQANKVEGKDIKFLPRLGAIWYPIEKLSVKALYGQAFRAPSLYEVGVNNPPFLVGDPNIKPEEVSSFDFGVNYQGTKFQVGVNYFRNDQKNIINYLRVDGQPTVYANLGEITFEGLEVEGKYYILNNLFFTGSALFQQNVNDKDVWSTTPISSFGAKAGLSYEWSKGLTLSLFDIYQGKLGDLYETTTVNSVNPHAGEYNILNFYGAVNMFKMFNWNPKMEATLFVQADNILNTQVWVPNMGTQSAATTFPLTTGSAVYVGVKAAF